MKQTLVSHLFMAPISDMDAPPQSNLNNRISYHCWMFPTDPIFHNPISTSRELRPALVSVLGWPGPIKSTRLVCSVCVSGVVWWRAVIQKWSAWIHIGGQEFPTTENSQTSSLYLINPCRTVLLHSRCPAFRQLLVCSAKSFDDYLMTSKAGGLYCDQT